MHISQIRIPGFGRLRGATSLETGRCNVLCQHNEFGKSTLMDAILYALYGFPSQRARNSVLKPKDKYKPWENGEGDGSFAVEMDLTAPDGRPMTLIADFRKSQSFELIDTRTLQPIALEGTSFGDKFFRMSLHSFTECFFYRQDEREGAERNELIRKIEEAVVSHRKDEPSSVRQALVSLEEVRLHLPEHSSDSVKPDTLQRRISESIAEARSKIERLEEERRYRSADMDEAARMDGELARLDRQRSLLEFAVIRAELEELEKRIQRRHELAAAHEARDARLRELQPFSVFDPALRAQAQSAFAEWESARRQNESGTRRRIGELQPKLETLIRERTDLPAGLASLEQSDAESMSGLRHRLSERERLLSEEETRVSELASKLEDCEDPLPDLEANLARLDSIETGDRTLVLEGAALRAQLEQETKELEQRRADATTRAQVAKNRKSQQGTLLTAAILVALAMAMFGVVLIFTRYLYMGVGLIALAVTGSVTLAYIFSRRQKSISAAELEPAVREEVTTASEIRNKREEIEQHHQDFEHALARAGVSTSELDRLRRADEWRGRAIPYLTARESAARLRTDCDACRAEAAALIERGGIAAASSNGCGTAELLERSSSQLIRHIQLRGEIAELERQLRESEAEHLAVENRLGSARTSLREALAPLEPILGDGPGDHADDSGHWERRMDQFRHACEQSAIYQSLQAEPAPELPVPEHELESARQRADNLREQLERLGIASPDVAAEAPHGNRGALQDELTATARQHEELQVHRLNLFSSCDQAMEAWRHEFPRLQDELTRLEAQRREVAEFAEAVEIARRELAAISEQVYAQWATAINERINRILPQLNPRYRDVACSDKLELSLYSEDAGRRLDSRELDHLSKGARDQIKIALRIAISEYLSAHVGILPLVFDEPFAHWDDQRFLEGMRYLAALAERHQVILLSCHHLRYDWLRETDPALAERLNFCTLE